MNSTIIWRTALGCATIFFTLTNLQASQEAQRALLELCTEGTHISKELKTYELLSSEGTVKGRQTAFKQPNLVFTVEDLGMTEYLRLHGPHATKLIAQFIGDGAKIDAYDIWGYTPLHVAAENGNIDVCCALIAKGALVNTRSKTDDRYTPLHCAAMKGHWMLCIELLKEAPKSLQRTRPEIRLYTKLQKLAAHKPLPFSYSRGQLYIQKMIGKSFLINWLKKMDMIMHKRLVMHIKPKREKQKLCRPL